MARLPIPGSDKGTWGDILNDYLSVSHNTDGTLKPSVVTASSPVASVVGRTGTITGSHILADQTVSAALAAKANIDLSNITVGPFLTNDTVLDGGSW